MGNSVYYYGEQDDPKKIDIKFMPKYIYQVAYVFSIGFTLNNSCESSKNIEQKY